MDPHRANAEAALARALELLTEREREVERLKRCNESLSATYAEIINTLRAELFDVFEELNECRRLLRIICTEYDTNAQHPGTHPVASEWCLVEESWWIQAKAAGGDDES